MNERTITQVELPAIEPGNRYFRRSGLEDDIWKMRESIEENGLKFPILLTPDMVLVDGLKRLIAYEGLSAESIPAFIPETFSDAIDFLIEVNEGEDISPARQGQMIMALRPLMLKDAAIARARGRWRATDPPRRHGKARLAYMEAFHTKAGVSVDRVRGIYMAAEVGGNEYAKELVKQIEAGTMTPSTAYSKLYHHPFFDGDVTARKAQENLLRNATVNLSAVVRGLTKLKSPIKVRPEVAGEALAELRKARATLISAIRELEKETGQSA